jgi:putative transcriptional regulator
MLGWVLGEITEGVTEVVIYRRAGLIVPKPTKVTNQIRKLHFAGGEMTQGESGDRVQVTRQTINPIEPAKYSPSLEVAVKISRVFGRPLEENFQYADVETP